MLVQNQITYVAAFVSQKNQSSQSLAQILGDRQLVEKIGIDSKIQPQQPSAKEE